MAKTNAFLISACCAAPQFSQKTSCQSPQLQQQLQLRLQISFRFSVRFKSTWHPAVQKRRNEEMKYNIQILVKLKGTVAKRKGRMRARGKAGYEVKGIMGVSAVSLDPLAEKWASRAKEKLQKKEK